MCVAYDKQEEKNSPSLSLLLETSPVPKQNTKQHRKRNQQPRRLEAAQGTQGVGTSYWKKKKMKIHSLEMSAKGKKEEVVSGVVMQVVMS